MIYCWWVGIISCGGLLCAVSRTLKVNKMAFIGICALLGASPTITSRCFTNILGSSFLPSTLATTHCSLVYFYYDKRDQFGCVLSLLFFTFLFSRIRSLHRSHHQVPSPTTAPLLASLPFKTINCCKEVLMRVDP